jgi:phosphohistidine phosphatase
VAAAKSDASAGRNEPATVRLYLLRHGPAGLRSAWTGDDSARPLTTEGARRMKRIAARLAAEGVIPELIVSSPYERALRTAKIVAKALGLRDLLLVEPTLAPGAGPAEVIALLEAHRDAASVMLVGHEPDFSEVTAAMCGARIKLQKGGLVEMELERAPGGVGPAVMWRLAQPSHLVG